MPEPKEEPFGYWIEQKGAEPVLLRKPAYIPEPSDLRTVTPLYLASLRPSPPSDVVEVDPMQAHEIEDAKVEVELARQRNQAGGWTGLAAELFKLHRAAYPAPWCWEQCGQKDDDPVIGAAWWDDDEDCNPIAGEVVAPADNVDRGLYREAIALEMPSHADGSGSANAALIVWLRNHVTEILNALASLSPTPKQEAGLVEEMERIAEVMEYGRMGEAGQQNNARVIRRAASALSRDSKAVELLREARTCIIGLQDMCECTCCFPDTDCCNWANADVLLARIDQLLERTGQ